MQRLTYSPSINAMIQTEAGIIDISDYIVRGSVNRVLNEVSTAQLEIRNPFKKFTKPGNPTFHPMDAIQIWGRRYKNHPVQLFTGYLDSTPYLQLFPGTVQLQASCTLKRLLHTYWDPGLPFVWQWLAKYGWQANPTTGEIFSTKEFTQGSGINPNKGGVSHREVENALITDGGIGNLLFNYLVEVCGWDGQKDPKDSRVLIEKLPDGIIQTVAALMHNFDKNNAATETEVKQFFSDLVGQYTGGGSVNGDGTTGTSGKKVKAVASTFGGTGGGSCGGLQSNAGHAYAELSYNSTNGSGNNYSAMGDLPCGHELTVTYNGKSLKLKKSDVGFGGCGIGSLPRVIDLYIPTAAALGIPNPATWLGVVEIEGLPSGTTLRGACGESVKVK